MANQEEIASYEIHLYAGKDVPKRYINLIRSRWMRSYKHDNDFMKLADPEGYYFSYSGYIESILNRPRTDVRFAVLSDDDDVVLGFSVTEANILHYVHVPKAYRKNGIAKMLLPDKIDWFSHLTKIGIKLWATKVPHAKFNPFV